MLLVAGVGLYFLWPGLLQVFSSWPGLLGVDPIWFVLMIAAEIGSFICSWVLLRLALRRHDWFLPATSQLASNAFSRIIPGGAATGGAMQYQMLTRGGIDGARVATGLTATTLINTGVLFTLPLLSLPALLSGIPVDRRLGHALWVGVLAFVLLTAAAAVAFVFDRPLMIAGRAAQWVRNMVVRRGPRLEDLPHRLLIERDLIRSTLGAQWAKALFAAVGRPLVDYLALLAALLAVGSQPYPSLVLMAYVVASLLGMIPITPGGLGFVEAGLAATLTLAGVGGAEATLAILAYRLVQYWLPLPAGLVAYLMYRRRYGALPQEEEVNPPAM